MGHWVCCWAWASSKANDSHHHDHAHKPDHHHGHGDAQHHHAQTPGPEGFGSLNLAVEALFNLRHCQHLLDHQQPESMSPAKGILWFLEGTSHHLVHLCGKRLIKMVAIGKGLDQPTLEARREVCVVAP
jgi:G3E family GTPase